MQQYESFGYAKLTLMLSIPDSINEELSPEMTKAEIQAVKEEVDEEKKVTPIERMTEEPAPEGSMLYKAIWTLGHDNADLFLDFYHDWYQTPEGSLELMAPDGMHLYSIRISGIGRVILKVSEDDLNMTNVRTGEKTKLTVEELIKAWSDVLFDEKGREANGGCETWEAIYGESFPEKEEVAPVQQSKVKKAKPEKTPEQKEAERQAKIDRETKKKLEEKKDEEIMNAPLPSETRETVHEVKTSPTFFQAAMSGKKRFELRKNDRGYHVGDTLIQKEFKDNAYTGYELTQEIVYMLEDFTGLEEGFCILGVENKDLKEVRSDG